MKKMDSHKFWAIAATFCMLMAMLSGYRLIGGGKK